MCRAPMISDKNLFEGVHNEIHNIEKPVLFHYCTCLALLFIILFSWFGTFIHQVFLLY